MPQAISNQFKLDLAKLEQNSLIELFEVDLRGLKDVDGINGERSSGGQPFAEAVADFEQGGGDDFEDDSEGEGKPGVHVDSWFGSVLRTG